jgi:Phage related hypothetical protein (DUF1799)
MGFGASRAEADVQAAQREASRQAQAAGSDCASWIDGAGLDAMSLFQAMSTQWLTAGQAGVRTGLNYVVLPMIANLLNLEMTAALFADLRLIEFGALEETTAKLAQAMARG